MRLEIFKYEQLQGIYFEKYDNIKQTKIFKYICIVYNSLTFLLFSLDKD